MSVASSLKGGGAQNAWDSIAASATDSVLVAAIPNKKIRVMGFLVNQGDTTASAFTFNSKGSGSGTAISPAFKYSANGGTSTTEDNGWFETNVGEGLTVTTGAGSTTGLVVLYKVVS